MGRAYHSASGKPIYGGRFAPSAGVVLAPISFTNTSASALANVPVSFAHAFKAGDLPASSGVSLVLADSTVVPAQIDVKATHADGTVRHAIVAAVLPSLGANEVKTASIAAVTVSAGTPAVPSDFPGLDAVVSIADAGVTYTASLAALLTSSANYTQWLSGGVSSGWLATGKLHDGSGNEHPYLHARFYVRAFKGQGKAKIDVVVENTWIKPAASGAYAFQPGPQLVTYSASITVGGVSVFSQASVTHYPFSRWKHTAWFGGAAPSVHVKHDLPYLISTLAVPNYDRSIVPDPTIIAANKNTLANNPALYHPGLMAADMGASGGRDDLALLPAWDVIFLLSQTPDSKFVTLDQADRIGYWSACFRNYATDRPITVAEYPYMTIDGSSGDTYNPTTGKTEAFQSLTFGGTPNRFESAHHTDSSYVAYLVTGDYFYLESLHFWSHYVTWRSNPGLRGAGKGLLNDQVRGVAWGVRTLAHAAYITPDTHPAKSVITTVLQNNFTDWDTRYTNNTTAPEYPLGILHDGQAFSYATDYNVNDPPTGPLDGVATWQDDYLVSAIGRAAELGFGFVAPFLAYKSKFLVQRLTSTEAGWSYVFASNANLTVRDTSGNFFSTLAQCRAATLCILQSYIDAGSGTSAQAALIQSTRYSNGRTVVPGSLVPDGSVNYDGYPSLMRAPLAYITGTGADAARAFYASLPTGRTADEPQHPQFAILHRS